MRGSFSHLLLGFMIAVVVTHGHVCHTDTDLLTRNCTFLETRSGALYIVPDFPGSDCEYSWSNSTGHVLANNHDMMDGLIMGSNRTFLQTRSRHETVDYSLHCMSGEKVKVKCFANCTRSEELLNAAGLVALVALVVLTLIGVLCCIFRKKICRCNYIFTPLGNQTTFRTN